LSIELIFKNLFKNCGKFNIVLSGVLIKFVFLKFISSLFKTFF